MMRFARLRARKLVVLVLVIPVAVAALVASGLTTANAAGPQLVARGDCSAHVTFTATAAGGDSAVPTVDVQYATGPNAAFTSIRGAAANTPDGALYTFNAANNFTFTDSFVLPASVQRPANIALRVVAGSSTSTINVAVPGTCAVPSAVINQPSCATPTANVIVTNLGTQEADFGFFKDNATTPFDTVSVTDGSKTVPVPVANAFLLAIHGPNMSIVQANVVPATKCDPAQVLASTSTTAAPGATTSTTSPSTTSTTAPGAPTPGLAVGCAANAMGWTVTFDNTKGTVPTTYLVRDDLNVNIDATIVPAGQTVTKDYPFAVTQGTDLSVTGNGTFIATGPTKIVCVDVGASVEPACNTAAGNGALLGFTDTGLVPETFTVTRDGTSVDGSPFTIQPSTLITQKLLPMVSGTTAVVVITGNNGFSLTKQITLNCAAAALASSQPPSVLGTAISRTQLPFTGIDLWPLMIFGTVLIVVGFALLDASADFAFAGRLQGVKSRAFGQSAAFAFRLRSVRSDIGEFFAPKGKHARRRRR